jgi:iron-sulfur cluster assembly accessory protein
MLQLTERAVAKVKKLMAAENKDGFGLRVAVKGGGCSGFQYAMSYEEAQGEADRVLEFDGLRVFVDALSVGHLEAVEIDYVDTLQESGFKIHNSSATGSCGCGASFSM